MILPLLQVAMLSVLAGCSSNPTSHVTTGFDIGTASVPGLGEILVNARGRVLYVYKPDRQGMSTCKGACAVVWPPAVSPGSVDDLTLGPGVDRSLVGTVRDADGTAQVTYDHWPLYTYRFDTRAGEASGQEDDMGLWQVIALDGKPIG